MSCILLSARQGLAGGYLCRWWSLQAQRYNSNKTSVCRMNRRNFPRLYPTMIVLTDGSTISARYNQPRKIIKLPADVSLMSEEQRKVWLKRRKPKQKLVIDDDLEDDSFDAFKYSHLWKK